MIVDTVSLGSDLNAPINVTNTACVIMCLTARHSVCLITTLILILLIFLMACILLVCPAYNVYSYLVVETVYLSDYVE